MDELRLSLAEVRRLLASGAGDAALVYLHLRAGGSPADAPAALHLSPQRFDAAMAALRQLGLYEEPARPVVRREPPAYSEQDVLAAAHRGDRFSLLVGEAQRRLGRVLSTEELKILLSMTDYLGLPAEVVGVLINFCIDRARARGLGRMPSLRTIEKEGYRWADEGIDTIEEASFYIQTRLARQSAVNRLQQRMQLTGRRLTQAEERYLLSWLELGFDEDAIFLAYERTCLNTGGMKWPYCNSILRSWDGKGLHTVAEIEAGDVRPGGPVPHGSAGPAAMGQPERDALQKLLQGAGNG